MKYWDTYKFIFCRVWHLLVDPQREWDSLLQNKNEPSSLSDGKFSAYLFIAAILWSILWALVYAEGSWFKTGLFALVQSGTTLFGGYVLSLWLARKTIGKFGVPRMTKRDVQTLITYSFVTFVAGQIIVALLPHSQYLYVIDAYAAYLLYRGIQKVVDRADYEVINPTMVFAFIELASVLLCYGTIKILFPNF